MNTTAKFYAVAVRYNPQLGSYLYKLAIGTRKDNKKSISLRFEEYGSERTMKFEQYANAEGVHYCKDQDESVYGFVTFYGFATPEAAMAYVRKWSEDKRAKEYIDALQKEVAA